MDGKETWESLSALGSGDTTTSDQGAPPPANSAAVVPPANPSEAVAPNPNDTTTEVKVAAPAGAPAADELPAGTEAKPPVAQPPAPLSEVKEPAQAKADVPGEEEETDAEKAEIEALPEAARPAARRNRKAARQFRAFTGAIGGEPFLEDAKQIVPTFHTKAAADFDEVLRARSPEKRTELYNHMVHTAVEGVDRPTLIRILADRYRPELEAALGVNGSKPETAPTTESHVAPPGGSPSEDATQALAKLDELLTDPYLTADQKVAIEAAKKSLGKPAQAAADETLQGKITGLEEQLRALLEEKNASATSSAAQETSALGDEFIDEVFTFVDSRLDELGLSAAEGDSPELVNYIKDQRQKIKEILPTRLQADNNGKALVSTIEGKLEVIPTLAGPLKAAEKAAAWRFVPAVKACVDELLGKEVSSSLSLIETARGARQAPNQGQRKEVVGHQPATELPPSDTLVKGKGVDALWAGITGAGVNDEFRA